MKKFTRILTSLFFVILLTLSAGVYAQDLTKVAAQGFTKILLENDQVRVLQIESPPGSVTPWHSHPNYTLYALTDGKLEETIKGKPAKIVEFKAGDVLYFPAVIHMAKNVGTSTSKLILTELKTTEKK